MSSVLPVLSQLAAIWLVVAAVVVVALTALVAPTRRPAAGPPADEDARRYADEIAVVAERAAATAGRRRSEWESADREVAAAWAAFDAADRAERRCRAAQAFPVPGTPVPPAECERYLHRSATAACRRRELGVAELNEVLAHRGGWDPRRHPLEQELALRRLTRQHLLRRYLAATERERRAWHAADVAAAAVRSLREEAFAARQRLDAPVRDTAADWLDDQLESATVTLPVLRPASLVSH